MAKRAVIVWQAEAMYDPTTRVLTVLELLQAKERVTGRELAQRLEVHPRTVQRYITRLQDLGVPVEATRGVGGAYRLKPGFRLPPLMFTTEEALALGMGLRALVHLGLGTLALATQAARAKLERVLPPALREELEAVHAAAALDESPLTVATDFRPVRHLIEAAKRRNVSQFTYTDHHGRFTKRLVEPYGVVHHDHRWYLVGRCRERAALRTFRIDRIEDVKVIDPTFTPPDDFDAKAYLHRTLPFAKSPWQVDVWLDMPLAEVERRTPPSRIQLRAEASGTALRCAMDDLDWLASRLLGLNCRVEVREPRELLDAFRRVGQRALDVRRAGDPID